nr:hypothetical protein [Rhizobium sp. G21]
MLPLPMIKTPFSRRARSSEASLLEMVLQPLRKIERQLEDRDIRLREHLDQHRPGAVIEPPAIVAFRMAFLQEVDRRLSEIRRARSIVLLREQFRRKTAEIVDGLGIAADMHQRRPPRHPVGGHAENGFRRRQALADLAPAAAVVIVEDRIHRAAVPDEQRRHARRRGQIGKSVAERCHDCLWAT